MTMHSKEEIIGAKMQPEDNISEDREKNKDHCSKTSGDVFSRCEAYLNLEDKDKSWYRVDLENVMQRDKQRALLLDVLKCDKSEVHSIYCFRDIVSFYAFMTEDEAEKFAKLEEVAFVEDSYPKQIRREKAKSRRKKYTVPKIKKQKISTGCILSERRKNGEKWRYDEDMELKDKKIKASEEELEDESEEESEDYCSSDSDGSSMEVYDAFDESGRRWYKVSLVNDKKPKEHLTLLRATLNRDESEISYMCKGILHFFEAYMTEEEADKVAGLEEVEFVEPRRLSLFKLD